MAFSVGGLLLGHKTLASLTPSALVVQSEEEAPERADIGGPDVQVVCPIFRRRFRKDRLRRQGCLFGGPFAGALALMAAIMAIAPRPVTQIRPLGRRRHEQFAAMITP